MKIVRAEPSRYHNFDDAHLGFIDRLFLKERMRQDDFNRRMFEEDFSRIFSYTSGDGDILFDVSSNDEHISERLLSNVQTRHGPHPVDKTIRKWVEDIAQSVIWFGGAHYFLRDDAESGNIHIASFSSVGVAHLFGAHIQWVPRRTERHWNHDDVELPREIRVLDSAKVICFVMPRAIKRMISRQNRTLAALDKHQFGAIGFQPQATHENPNPTSYFDFSDWRDTQERALYRATRATGWNGRKYDSSKRSDFFDCYRLIRFRRNQLILRDDILSQLSAELTRAGQSYNAKFSIEVSGTEKLPTVAYLDELEARLTREEVGFTEIVDYCFKR